MGIRGQRILGCCYRTASPPHHHLNIGTPSPPASPPTQRRAGGPKEHAHGRTHACMHTGVVIARRASIRMAAENTAPWSGAGELCRASLARAARSVPPPNARRRRAQSWERFTAGLALVRVLFASCRLHARYRLMHVRALAEPAPPEGRTGRAGLSLHTRAQSQTQPRAS